MSKLSGFTNRAADHLEDAEDTLRDLAKDFSVLIADDFVRCKSAMTRIHETNPPDEEALRELLAAAHNIKGVGGSFGYHLATEVGHSLCVFLRQLPQADETAKKVMQAHLSALDLIIQQSIAGDGGELGEKLLQKLRSAADTVIDGQGGPKSQPD